jgi:hypothetical protein
LSGRVRPNFIGGPTHRTNLVCVLLENHAAAIGFRNAPDRLDLKDQTDD